MQYSRIYSRAFCLLICVSMMMFVPQKGRAEQGKRKKVALVLSGGGAKGAAHIGAIKVIEEAGVPVDMVVGTSIGAIVGGLYSIGYTPEQLDSMARKLEWDVLLSDRVRAPKRSLMEREQAERYLLSVPLHRKHPKVSGLINGENLNTLFSELTVGYHGQLDFDSLPRPFACIATEMQTGREHIFRSGDLPTAIRASMAFPGVFAPVLLDSMVLLDGGMRNNYPADVARAMGADVVIGVSVQEKLQTDDDLSNMSDLLMRVMSFMSQDKLEENIGLTDVFIHVDTHPYTTMSFSHEAVDSLLIIGENTARQHFDALQALRAKIGLKSDERVTPPEPYTSYATEQGIVLKKITFSGTTTSEEQHLLKRSRLKEGQSGTLSQIETAVAIMRDELAYADVTYQLYNEGDGHRLHFSLQRKKEMNLNVGARFDTEEIASVMLNASLRFDTPVPSRLSLTGRVGKRYLGRIDYRLTPGLMKHVNCSYQYYHGDCDIFRKGDRLLNATYDRHTVEVNYSNVWWRNFRYDLGISADAYTQIDLLTVPTATNLPIFEDSWFVNYFFRLRYNSYDSSYFPKRGSMFSAGYNLVTDNFYGYDGKSPFSVVEAAWERVVRLGSRSVLQPSVHGRAVIGKNTSPLYYNALGGERPGYLLPHQLPFDGITHIETVDRAALVGNLKFRQRIAKNHYATLSASIAITGHEVNTIFRHAPIYGGAVGYALDTKLGPLQTLLGYSPYTKKMNFFVNAGFYF